MRTAYLIFTGLLVSFCLCAQEREMHNREEADSLVNPSLMHGAERLIKADRTVQDIGVLTEDDRAVTYRFTCTNISGRTIRLTRIRTTCRCLSAEMVTGELPAGESVTISLTYNPKNYPGKVNSKAFVYTSESDRSPALKLSFTGEVLPGKDVWSRYPHAMGPLRLKQKSLDFSEVSEGGRYTERILCGNSGNIPLRLASLILPPYSSFRTEPEIILPGEEADIVVTVDENKIPDGGQKEFSFPIIIEGILTSPSERTLNIKIKYIK